MKDDRPKHEGEQLSSGAMEQLLSVMAQLRDPENGCPWDVEQTFQTIAPYTIEEAYEVADAIERRAYGELRDELGDLLFQVVFHAQMAREDGLFAFADVVDAITDKMIRRHPHVFADAEERTADQQTVSWEQQKAAERAAKGAGGVLDDVPSGLPGLTRAMKLQKRAARVGFDWPTPDAVAEKIDEEVGELLEAAKDGDADHLEEEFGDFLFVVANLARHFKIDPEAALRRANQKFIRRFGHIEASLERDGRSLDDASLDDMEALWQEAKAQEKTTKAKL
ncbi:MAG: nucleoside triphosphate pyrophosphohydrolase [Pseudomonadota bacterium]